MQNRKKNSNTKTEQRIERDIIRELTEVCEQAKIAVTGFEWLTHEVDYQRFPQSLRVVLVFSDRVSESQVMAGLQALIPEVQRALQLITNTTLSAQYIKARQQRTMH